MDINIHIHATIHIHSGDLSKAISDINKLTADEAAKTDNLNTAVDAAKGTQP